MLSCDDLGSGDAAIGIGSVIGLCFCCLGRLKNQLGFLEKTMIKLIINNECVSVYQFIFFSEF